MSVSSDLRATASSCDGHPLLLFPPWSPATFTDMCYWIGTTFLALSLREEGYSVWANAEASGTSTTFVRDISNDRMARAGVQVVSLFSIVCDLWVLFQRPDSTPGLPARSCCAAKHLSQCVTADGILTLWDLRMRDWRNTPGAKELFPFLDKYYPIYTMVARAHKNAIENGTIIDGERDLPQ